MTDPAEPLELRLDKWLWAARFFKTRQLAIEAVNGGKVQVDGQRAKPSRMVRVGSRLEIHKGSLAWTVQVTAIDKQRRSASEAAKLFLEDPASRERRETMVRERRELNAGALNREQRPNKRERRLIRRFTGRDAADS